MVDWLRSAGASLDRLHIEHQPREIGKSGDYTLDDSAELDGFFGAKFKVLVECKKHNRPIGLDTILGMHNKLLDLGWNKAMVFSTASFQKGAIEYGSRSGMDLVSFIDGKLTFFTRSAEGQVDASYPEYQPKFSGKLLHSIANVASVKTIASDNVYALRHWLEN